MDRLLCDRLVCGLRDETIQRRLLAEPDLKLSKAILLARAAEEAAAKTEELRRSKANSVVDANQLQKSSKLHGAKGPACAPMQPCWRCTAEHDARTCSYHAAVRHFMRQIRGTSKGLVGRKQRKKSKLPNPVIERGTPRKSRNIVDATITFRSPVIQLRTSTPSQLLTRTQTSLRLQRPSPSW